MNITEESFTIFTHNNDLISWYCQSFPYKALSICYDLHTGSTDTLIAPTLTYDNRIFIIFFSF